MIRKRIAYAFAASVAAFSLMWFFACHPDLLGVSTSLSGGHIPGYFYLAEKQALKVLFLFAIVSPAPIISGFVIVTSLLNERPVPENGRRRLKLVLASLFMLFLAALTAVVAFFLHTDSMYCRGCETGSCFGFSFFKWAQYVGIGLLLGFAFVAARIAVAETAKPEN